MWFNIVVWPHLTEMTPRRTWSARSVRRKCRADSSANSVRKEKIEKKTHTRKENIIRFLQSVGFGKTSQIIPIVGNPRRAKQKSSELVIGLDFSLWSLFCWLLMWAAVARSPTLVPEVCVKPPRSQRRRFPPHKFCFFYFFRLSFLCHQKWSTECEPGSRHAVCCRSAFFITDLTQSVNNIQLFKYDINCYRTLVINIWPFYYMVKNTDWSKQKQKSAFSAMKR